MRTHKGTGRSAGFSLIEVVITVAVFTVLMSSAVVTLNSAQGSSDQTVRRSVLNARTGRVLSEVTANLRGAGADALLAVPALPNTVEQLGFSQATGLVNQAIVWSDQMELRLEYMPGEINNGLDDNGDGFVDECRVVRVNNPGTPDEQILVLGTRVAEFYDGELPNLNDDNGNGLIDERGFCFYRTGNVLHVLLTMLSRDSEGNVGTSSSSTTVALRN